MSLYKDASLVMIPSAVKDGKLYSMRPTDGDGDFTFSRGSNLAATRVDVNGLIEKGRENLLLQSNSFSTSPFVTSNVSLTSGQSGYDGTNDAWELSTTGVNGFENLYQNISFTGVHTISIYAKAGSNAYLTIRSLTSDFRVQFKLDDGTHSATFGSPINTFMEDAGAGWYRCGFTANFSSASSWVFYPQRIGITDAGNIYIQDAQLESSMVATDYIETGASTAQAGILEDLPRLDYSGGASCPSLLLEPQRTNALITSEYFEDSSWLKFGNASVTSNAAISPEGVQNASLLSSGTTTALYNVSGAGTASQPYTASVYVKKISYNIFRMGMTDDTIEEFSWNINLDTLETSVSVPPSTWTNTSAYAEDVGNGWVRCWVTGTKGAAGNARIVIKGTSGSQDYYIYGAQLETGSYPTSYIPTMGSAVTRSVDNAVATHTIADTETLTYFSEFIAPERQSGGGEHLLENSSGSSRIRVYQNNSTTIRVRTDVPSANFDYTYSSLGISVGDKVKICLRIENGVMTAFINGVEKNTFAAATINFGRLHLRPQSIMNVDSTIIFPTALTDSECIALTTL